MCTVGVLKSHEIDFSHVPIFEMDQKLIGKFFEKTPKVLHFWLYHSVKVMNPTFQIISAKKRQTSQLISFISKSKAVRLQQQEKSAKYSSSASTENTTNPWPTRNKSVHRNKSEEKKKWKVNRLFRRNNNNIVNGPETKISRTDRLIMVHDGALCLLLYFANFLVNQLAVSSSRFLFASQTFSALFAW